MRSRLALLLAAVNTMQTVQTLNPAVTLRTTHLPAPLLFARQPKEKAQWKRERQGR